MQITFYGQSAFRIVGEGGARIVIDPYVKTERISYEDDFDEADIVLVTHEHGDHNNVDAVPGDYDVVRGEGTHQVRGIEFLGIGSYHDQAEGAERGPNTIFVFDLDGVRIAHFGDQGCELEEDQMLQLEGVQVMIVPVGGGFTLDPERIWTIAERIRPNVVIPCHFKTDKVQLPFATLDDFLAGKERVQRPGGGEANLDPGNLPEPITVLALEPAR